MSDMQQLFTAIGELQGSMREIKKNTDKIPDLAAGLLIAQNDLKIIKPVLRRHEKIVNWGGGICSVAAVGWSLFLAIVSRGK